MDIVIVILMMVVAVLLSVLLSQLIPRVSTPLIQIALGLCIALFVQIPTEIDIDSELFLLIFIAPLLFKEAKNTDKLAFWSNKRMIISLALGLVIAITLIVGFMTHLLVPSIALTAAFALGAALGPTDAVAISALSKSVKLTKRQSAILSGESLINDASGIVSFQFAVAAALTGTFSLIEAAGSFALLFFGGILFGILVGYLGNIFIAFIRKCELENMTFHVLFEVALPFICFLAAESLDVSGILAVVACGLIFNITKTENGPSTARLSIVSSSVWEVLAFALNGIVFVLLGCELPSAVSAVIASEHFSTSMMLCYVVIITVVLLLVRFCWIRIVNKFFVPKKMRDETQSHRDKIKDAAVLTFAGAKGTITLMIAFTIPIGIGSRDALMFLASGVIILSLLLANICIPILSPAEEESAAEKFDKIILAKINILRTVMEKLGASIEDKSALAYQNVIKGYNKRIYDLQNSLPSMSEKQDEQRADLMIQSLLWEEEKVFELIENGTVPEKDGNEYLHQLSVRISKIRNKGNFRRVAFQGARFAHLAYINVKLYLRSIFLPSSERRQNKNTAMKRFIRTKCAIYAIKELRTELSKESYPTEMVMSLILEYQKTLRMLKENSPSITQIARVENESAAVLAKALRIELEAIQDSYDNEEIDRATMKKMKQNVYMMQIDQDGLI